MQDDNEIDLVVKPILEFVQRNIDCLLCGNCCRTIRPTITKGDMGKLKKELKLNIYEIIEKYTEKGEDEELLLRGKPCCFLNGNECKIYKNRPFDCESFPHLHKKRFTSRLFGIIDNLEICPIVYNVYEQLKIKLNFR